MKKGILLVLLLTFISTLSISQELPDGQILWSSENRLSEKDFQIKINSNSNSAVFSQFYITHSINGFDFLKKNLNQRIKNIFIGNASWIDTTKTKGTYKLIEYQQMQFDLAEIYTRTFRKRILIKKNEIVKGTKIIEKINDEVMTEFSETRLDLEKETEGGQNKLEVNNWKKRIELELKELIEFKYENKKKIKLK